MKIPASYLDNLTPHEWQRPEGRIRSADMEPVDLAELEKIFAANPKVFFSARFHSEGMYALFMTDEIPAVMASPGDKITTVYRYPHAMADAPVAVEIVDASPDERMRRCLAYYAWWYLAESAVETLWRVAPKIAEKYGITAEYAAAISAANHEAATNVELAEQHAMKKEAWTFAAIVISFAFAGGAFAAGSETTAASGWMVGAEPSLAGATSTFGAGWAAGGATLTSGSTSTTATQSGTPAASGGSWLNTAKQWFGIGSTLYGAAKGGSKSSGSTQYRTDENGNFITDGNGNYIPAGSGFDVSTIAIGLGLMAVAYFVVVKT